MEIRVLKYFLTVAREQNITRAAETLHMTQPTLSRQLAALEEELGTTLFVRGNRNITLTEAGILLKRRALEILNLEEKTIEELRNHEELVEGSVTIGCGEFGAVESLSRICEAYRAKYPKVQIKLHTATADIIQDMMKQGLVDIGLLMEPVDTSEFEYIRLPEADSWVVTMKPDDPMAQKDAVTRDDLLDKPLILPSRLNIQSELANWFGKDFEKLNVAFVANLATNAAVMAKNGLAYPVTIEGAMKFWREDFLVNRKLYPELVSYSVLAWRRNIPYSTAARKFIEEINAFKA
ncbi:MAG: LysR family transcriptional regulator [Bacillota bacterium]|nr:LysR family transcriptional regulator [Bacillota bacterium]